MADKRQRIDELLERHGMTLEYDHIFDRWFFTLYDRQGAVVWECKGIGTRLEAMRDDLLAFLESYGVE
jgi:hypothetical protein